MADGFDTSSMQPADAVTALRSFGRRWRAAFALAADGGSGDEAADALVRRRSADGSPSALDHATAIGHLLAGRAEDVRAVLTRDRPALARSQEAPSVRLTTTAALDALAERADALAAALDRVGAEDWVRVGVLPDGQEASVLALARSTVAESVTALRAAERTITSLRGRPSS